MEKIYRSKRYIALFILPGLLLYVTILFIPIIQSIFLSFYKWDGMSQGLFIGFKNYINLMHDNIFLLALKNNFIILIMSFVVNLTVPVFFAYVISRSVKGSKIFRTLFFLPVVISSAVVGLLWGFVFDVRIGIVHGILGALGLNSLAQFDLLGNTNTVIYVVGLVAIWQWLGYFMILFLAGINGVPEEMYESAKLDGAGEFVIFRKIVLPMITPIIKVSCIFICTGALKTFDIIYVMTGGGPIHASEVIATNLFDDAFHQMLFGYSCAISTVMLIISIGLTLIINRKSMLVSEI